ncbi:hypothetical protein PFISCL1PPCAC_26276, partial [Pristionchus fissidentatus]
ISLQVVSVLRNFSSVTRSLCVSERLPRAADLLFFNLTTSEGDAYCVELSARGWRVASLVHDSMNGDFRRIDLFIVYYQTLTELLRGVSLSFDTMLVQSQLLTPSSSSCCSTPTVQSP